MKNGTERFESGSRGSSFVVVDPIELGVTLGDILNLVADNLARIIPFLLTYQLALERVPARRQGRSVMTQFPQVFFFFLFLSRDPLRTQPITYDLSPNPM